MSKSQTRAALKNLKESHAKIEPPSSICLYEGFRHGRVRSTCRFSELHIIIFVGNYNISTGVISTVLNCKFEDYELYEYKDTLSKTDVPFWSNRLSFRIVVKYPRLDG